MSTEELEQRQEAARTHGAYAFEKRGEQALDNTGRSRIAELREIVQNRQGVLSLMQEKAADAVLMFEIVQAHVAKEAKAGKSISDISALKQLPAFMNSMQRALSSLLSLMPDDKNALDIAGTITKAMEEHERNS
ncbi:hypothetical protein EHM76_00435 [bacterium]|nr:MAG: hypothetical protein EHM76_00435 [bacterium]